MQTDRDLGIKKPDLTINFSEDIVNNNQNITKKFEELSEIRQREFTTNHINSDNSRVNFGEEVNSKSTNNLNEQPKYNPRNNFRIIWLSFRTNNFN